MQRFIALCGVLAVMAAGCTRVEVHKNPDSYDKGVRFYRPKPYLFISPGSASGAGPVFSVSQGPPLKVQNVPTASATLASPDVQQAAFQEQSAEPVALGMAVNVESESKQLTTKCPDLALAPNKAVCSQRPTAISMTLQYLPDFSEEYSIQLKPGLGIGHLECKLDNGWNLTSVGMDTDQQTDEIIKSTADLLGSIAGFVPKGGPENFDESQTRVSQPCGGAVYATNVPFGYYEAVIATDPCGRKQLYGWRYVGFMPFQCCPVQMGGMERMCCNECCENIYGLVWVNGILQFQQIATIPREAQTETIQPQEKEKPK